MQEDINPAPVSQVTDCTKNSFFIYIYIYIYILKILSRLRRRFLIEFHRGTPQSIQANFKLYDVVDHKVAREADAARANDLYDSSNLPVKIMFR